MTRARLEYYINWSLKASSICEMKFSDRCSLASGRKRALPYIAMIQAFLLSRDVRSNKRLKAVLSKAVRFALDPALAAVVLDKETWSVVPDASRLSRANSQIDLAFMMSLRERHHANRAEKRWHFLKIYSSPQGGKDWMVSEMLTLEQKDMGTLSEVFQDLAAQRQESEAHIQASAIIFDILKSHMSSMFRISSCKIGGFLSAFVNEPG